MSGNVLFVLDDFDPIDNYVLSKVKLAHKYVNFEKVIYKYYSWTKKTPVINTATKIELLSNAICGTLSPTNIIDAESFVKNISLLDLEYGKYKLFLLLDSYQLSELIKDHSYPLISNYLHLVLYLFPEHQDLMSDSRLGKSGIVFLDHCKKTSELRPYSLFDIKEDLFDKAALQHCNTSLECGWARIKRYMSTERFEHTQRVFDLAKRMSSKKNLEFRTKLLLAAIYHDICKEFMNKKLSFLYNKYVLSPGSSNNFHIKVLHGPVAAWYIKTKFLLSDNDVLMAVRDHTSPPSANVPLITKMLFLADHLEPEKEEKYGDLYGKLWSLIFKEKIDEAFNLLLEFDHKKYNK